MFKKKHKQSNGGKIIIPVGNPNPPEQHEIDIAVLLAQHYRTVVEFLIPIDDYMRKTADIKMLGDEWEIKSPIGGSKTTIGAQLRRASRQSGNIVLDTRRTRLKYEAIEKQVIVETKQRVLINRVILIDKFGKIIEIQK